MADERIEKVRETVFLKGSQVARLFGISKSKFTSVKRNVVGFPAPIDLDGQQVFSRKQVERWVAQITGEIEV